MTFSLTDTRQFAVATAVCMAGAVLAPVVPMVGFPMCAFALAGLVYGGKGASAAFIAGFALAIAVLLRPIDAAMLAPGLVAVLVAAGSTRKSPALNVTFVLVLAFALLFALSEYANVWLMGLTYREYVTQTAQMAESALSGLPSTMTGEQLIDTIVRFAPSGYVVLAVLTVIPTMVAIGQAAVRGGAEANLLPRLDEVDLSPHVVWVPIAALLAMAAGRFLGQPDGLLVVIGLNLLIAARVALFIQGLGVLSSWLRTVGVGRVGRLFAYVAAFLADSATWIVSLMGLIDFWVNLRKIDRGDSGDRAEPESVV